MNRLAAKSKQLGEMAVPIRRYCADSRGSIAIKFAFTLPLMLMLVGKTIDYGRYLRQESTLQAAADAAVLAATKELSLTDAKLENLASVSEAVVRQQLQAVPGLANDGGAVVQTTYSGDPIEVAVKVSGPFSASFGDIFGFNPTAVNVQATARVMGRPNICVLGLSATEKGTISLEHKAYVTANNCAVYSNSANSQGIRSKNDAVLSASIICSRGGKDSDKGNFNPEPLQDCPSFDDPLAGRPEPPAGACDPKLPTVIKQSMRLQPGTYCGLEIASGARVDLDDGIYVIKDKPLVVGDGASLFGASAGLYFTGKDATFTFEQKSTISLAAPKSGPMAGLLVFGARNQQSKLRYQVLSDDARILIGTIYLPKGELHIDASKPIADQSAYTAIVAETMRLYGGPHLVLNTNFSLTDIPVPDGIKGAGQPVSLVK